MKDPKPNQVTSRAHAQTSPGKPIQRWSAARKRAIVLRLLRGESVETVSREIGLEPYRLDQAKLSVASPGCLVLHCLPAHRGEEISAGVIDGPNSVVWEQAENRLHTQKALIAWLLEQP